MVTATHDDSLVPSATNVVGTTLHSVKETSACCFHIKSEGIGLIEAGGLFILPARLKRQMAQVAECVEQKYTLEEAKKHFDDIEPFWVSVEKIRETGESLEDYLGDVCQNILKDVAVFKEDGVGQAGIARFVEACEL